MFESLDRCDPLGLVQTEKLLEEVHSLAGYNAGWRGVSGESSGSQTLADLGEVRLGQVQAEGDSPLVPFGRRLNLVATKKRNDLGQSSHVVRRPEERVGPGEEREEDDAHGPHVHGYRLRVGLEEDLGRSEAWSACPGGV